MMQLHQFDGGNCHLTAGSIYNPGQNVLGHLRKLGTKTHFAKLTHILPLKKAWDAVIRGYFCCPLLPQSVLIVLN